MSRGLPLLYILSEKELELYTSGPRTRLLAYSRASPVAESRSRGEGDPRSETVGTTTRWVEHGGTARTVGFRGRAG